MSPERVVLDYLEDILDTAIKTVEFTDGMSYETFTADDKTVFAVIRAFEVMGEATKNIPSDFQQQHADIPWREMAGMRDVLIHDYFGVNREVIWLTVTEQIPQLIRGIRSLIAGISD